MSGTVALNAESMSLNCSITPVNISYYTAIDIQKTGFLFPKCINLKSHDCLYFLIIFQYSAKLRIFSDIWCCYFIPKRAIIKI